MKTKISLVLLGLGLACGSAAYAGHAEETPLPVSNDINVTAPDQSGMWSFGATAVLMQPTNSAFTYADLYSAPGDDFFPYGDFDHKDVNQSYHWWFGADVTYSFPGNGRDVTLAYEGLHGSDTNSVSVDPATTFIVSPFNPIAGLFADGYLYTDAAGKEQTSYDAGDLVFGQKLDVGQRIRLHPFAGVRYAHINVKSTGSYAGIGVDDDTFTFIENGELNNTFNGIGPRLGSDAQVNLGDGFSVRARLGVSALIGSAKVTNTDFENIYDAVSGELIASESTLNTSHSNTQVIPEVDGRLGLNYTYNFDTSMALGVEAGWQATTYFNVIQDDGYNSFASAYPSTSNFAVQGPYARLQLDIA